MTGDPTRPPRVVVMGVSASGKSSVGRALADRLGVAFADADDLHPAANIEKMSAGIPLNDDDRWPWLDLTVARLGSEPGGMVIACSALRRAYRDRIVASAPDVVFVHLTGSVELLAQRAKERLDHFMPAALLTSQLETLEDLEDDEPGFALDFSRPVAELVEEAAGRIP
ncbi:gluconokinase [Microbacterium dauci]|uniref:Gluconokinase n=1 Tax=Microbacterium dauci TaxID=3048008 RepID=A0ABT6ZH20_9MICO|nr:gluconokinase [Microbacterium sp. LX3-4]MDJ1115461.1 gluconokinase [Microbacterium sp. LX3-4]